MFLMIAFMVGNVVVNVLTMMSRHVLVMLFFPLGKAFLAWAYIDSEQHHGKDDRPAHDDRNVKRWIVELMMRLENICRTTEKVSEEAVNDGCVHTAQDHTQHTVAKVVYAEIDA